MTVIYKVIICAVVALVLASFYSGYLSKQTITFAFDAISFIVFLCATLLATGLASLVKPSSTDTSSLLKSGTSSLLKSGTSSLLKSGTQREQGKVKWFNFSKGFGFITRDQGDDIFVHYRSIQGKGKRTLYEGQIVEFIVTEGDKGYQAEDVEVIGKGDSK